MKEACVFFSVLFPTFCLKQAGVGGKETLYINARYSGEEC